MMSHRPTLRYKGPGARVARSPAAERERLGRQVGRPMMMASGEHAALDLGNACDCLV